MVETWIPLTVVRKHWPHPGLWRNLTQLSQRGHILRTIVNGQYLYNRYDIRAYMRNHLNGE